MSQANQQAGEASDLSFQNLEQLLFNLASIYSTAGSQPFEDVLIIGMQHQVTSNVDMFATLKRLGAKHMILGSKSYSDNPANIQRTKDLGIHYIPSQPQLCYGRFNRSLQTTIERLWNCAMEEINRQHYEVVIILDLGADLIVSTRAELFNGKNRPNMVFGIEQTTHGTQHPEFRHLPFPIVKNTDSFANAVEYPYIAEMAVKKILDHIRNHPEPCKSPSVGVVGYGIMGEAMVKEFVSHQFPVEVFEVSEVNVPPQLAQRATDLGSLIRNNDIIIGSTNKDITQDPECLNEIIHCKKPKLLASVSSNDIEFNSLLNQVQKTQVKAQCVPNVLEDIHYINACGVDVCILQGGFPISFETQSSPSSSEIWLTSASMLLSAVMCMNEYNANKESLKACHDLLPMDPMAQNLILQTQLVLDKKGKVRSSSIAEHVLR